MNRRPVSVSLIACLYLAVGVIGAVSCILRFPMRPFPYDLLWASLVDLVAVVSGAYLLRGHNWARWLALFWMGFHAILSAFHAWREAAIHALLFAVIACVLLRPESSAYFRRRASRQTFV